MRVLIMIEDELLGDCIYYGLNHYKYNADLTKDHDYALSLLEKEIFDLVIVDLDLTKNIGECFIKNVRLKNTTIPILVMDSYNNSYGLGKILEIGATDCIEKPFDLDQLGMHVNEILKT